MTGRLHDAVIDIDLKNVKEIFSSTKTPIFGAWDFDKQTRSIIQDDNQSG